MIRHHVRRLHNDWCPILTPVHRSTGSSRAPRLSPATLITNPTRPGTRMLRAQRSRLASLLLSKTSKRDRTEVSSLVTRSSGVSFSQPGRTFYSGWDRHAPTARLQLSLTFTLLLFPDVLSCICSSLPSSIPEGAPFVLQRQPLQTATGRRWSCLRPDRCQRARMALLAKQTRHHAHARRCSTPPKLHLRRCSY